MHCLDRNCSNYVFEMMITRDPLDVYCDRFASVTAKYISMCNLEAYKEGKISLEK